MKPPAPTSTSSGGPPSYLGRGAILLAIPLLIILILPLLALIANTPLSQLWTLLRAPVVRQSLRLTLQTSLLTVAATLLLGTPLAYGLGRRSSRRRALVDTLLTLPMVLPPAVAGIGLLLAFGRYGLSGRLLALLGITLPFTPAAVVIAQIFVASPYYIKTAISGFLAIEPELEEAAALDGADPWSILRLVSMPLALPSLAGGIVMTWARAIGEFGATIIFAGNLPGRTQTMPLAIYLGFEIDFAVALTLAMLLLLFAGGALLIARLILQNHLLDM
ncbi:MAG: hypothetical protein NVS4B8_01710 [Herpetosiphon sp.]